MWATLPRRALIGVGFLTIVAVLLFVGYYGFLGTTSASGLLSHQIFAVGFACLWGGFCLVALNEMLKLIPVFKRKHYLLFADCLFVVENVCLFTIVVFFDHANLSHYLCLVLACMIVYFLGSFISIIWYKWTNFRQLFFIMGFLTSFSVFFNIFLYLMLFQSMQIILMILVIAMLSDTCAFLIGTKFGKHVISVPLNPKKTWEGFTGGVFLASVGGVGLYLLLWKCNFLGSLWAPSSSQPLAIFWASLIGLGISFWIACCAQLGDLSFSFVKRQYKIKDFSSFFDIHGGVLDRLDSIVFALLAGFLTFLIHLVVQT